MSYIIGESTMAAIQKLLRENTDHTLAITNGDLVSLIMKDRIPITARLLSPERIERSKILSEKICDFLGTLNPAPLGGDIMAAFIISALGIARSAPGDPRETINRALDEWEEATSGA